MQLIQLNKSQGYIDIGKLQMALINIYGQTSDKVLINIADELNPDLVVIQSIIDGLAAIAPQYVYVQVLDVFSNCDVEDISIVANDVLFMALCRQSDNNVIKFNQDLAQKFISHLDLNTTVTDDTTQAIASLFTGNGLTIVLAGE